MCNYASFGLFHLMASHNTSHIEHDTLISLCKNVYSNDIHNPSVYTYTLGIMNIISACISYTRGELIMLKNLPTMLCFTAQNFSQLYPDIHPFMLA